MKFLDKTAELLNDIALNGFTDDQYGSVDEHGWFGLILEHKAIITEDSQGFFDYDICDTEQDARDKFNQIVGILELINSTDESRG